MLKSGVPIFVESGHLVLIVVRPTSRSDLFVMNFMPVTATFSLHFLVQCLSNKINLVGEFHCFILYFYVSWLNTIATRSVMCFIFSLGFPHCRTFFLHFPTPQVELLIVASAVVVKL